MTATVPTTRRPLEPEWFARGLSVLSGDGVADEPFGYDGVAAEANHAYAHRTQQSASASRALGGSDQLFATANSAAFEVGLTYLLPLGPDVARLEIVLDIQQATARLVSDNAATVTGAAVTVRAEQTLTLTLTDKTGILTIVTIALQAEAAQTGRLFGASIREIPLLSADLPT